LIETRRLKVECRQYRAGAPTPPPFLLCHGEDPATEPATPQVLRKKKPLNRQEAEIQLQPDAQFD
jgi:hypothetical protein